MEQSFFKAKKETTYNSKRDENSYPEKVKE
jgi:hypothetical protein